MKNINSVFWHIHMYMYVCIIASQIIVSLFFYGSTVRVYGCTLHQPSRNQKDKVHKRDA